MKGQIQPSHLLNLQPYRLISHFHDKYHPKTFYLPDLKYHASLQGTSRDKFNINIYQTCNHIGENLIFTTRVIAILLIYRIQNQIRSQIKGHIQPSHL